MGSSEYAVVLREQLVHGSPHIQQLLLLCSPVSLVYCSNWLVSGVLNSHSVATSTPTLPVSVSAISALCLGIPISIIATRWAWFTRFFLHTQQQGGGGSATQLDVVYSASRVRALLCSHASHA